MSEEEKRPRERLQEESAQQPATQTLIQSREELITEWKNMRDEGERENTDLIQPVIRSTKLKMTLEWREIFSECK